jgi:23S rRNA (uridine2552-2'-O)-methyltransferase
MLPSSPVYQRKDAFYRRAKAVGYRSRAAFKLQELARRQRVFHRGDRVVDLGAWPGGWLQVAAQHVGPTGKVIGIDLQPIGPLPDKNVVTIVGDIATPPVQQRVAQACGGQADVILSDLAPKLSGVRVRDEAQAQELVESALQVTARMLKPGGKLIMKLFMTENLPQLTARLRTRFREIHITRPTATRRGSAEIYAIGSGFDGEHSPI